MHHENVTILRDFASHLEYLQKVAVLAMNISTNLKKHPPPRETHIYWTAHGLDCVLFDKDLFNLELT